MYIHGASLEASTTDKHSDTSKCYKWVRTLCPTLYAYTKGLIYILTFGYSYLYALIRENRFVLTCAGTSSRIYPSKYLAFYHISYNVVDPSNGFLTLALYMPSSAVYRIKFPECRLSSYYSYTLRRAQSH